MPHEKVKFSSKNFCLQYVVIYVVILYWILYVFNFSYFFYLNRDFPIFLCSQTEAFSICLSIANP